MFTRETRVQRVIRPMSAAAFMFVAVAVAGAETSKPSFSEAATDEEVALVYLSIQPDGENLPAGSGTAEQGEPLYQLHCASCHGADGEGGLANKLVGGHGTLASDAPVRTLGSYWPYATTVFNYVRRSMPYQEPMSLSNDDYYAITAWMLNKNDIIAADAVMDKNTLPAVVMPNRDGFINAYPDIPDEYDYME